MSPIHETAIPFTSDEVCPHGLQGWPSVASFTSSEVLQKGPIALGGNVVPDRRTDFPTPGKLDSGSIHQGDFFLELFAVAVASGLAAAVALIVAKDWW
jgi:hypothetical protein